MRKYLHVIGTGTSVLRNFERYQDYGNIIEKYGLRGWGELSPNDFKQKVIESFIMRGNEVHEKLLEFIRRDPKYASAELNSFLRYVDEHRHSKDYMEVVIYCTDTNNNRLAAQVIYEWLRENDYYVVSEPIKVKDFGVGIEKFDSGLINLLERVLRIIVNKSKQGYKIYINATAGYKPETTFIVIAAMLTLKTAPTIYYIHEAFRETIELPTLPLKIDESWVEIAKMFIEPKPMHDAREILKKFGYNLDDLIYSGTLLIDTDKGIVQTREWLKKIIELNEA